MNGRQREINQGQLFKCGGVFNHNNLVLCLLVCPPFLFSTTRIKILIHNLKTNCKILFLFCFTEHQKLKIQSPFCNNKKQLNIFMLWNEGQPYFFNFQIIIIKMSFVTTIKTVLSFEIIVKTKGAMGLVASSERLRSVVVSIAGHETSHHWIV